MRILGISALVMTLLSFVLWIANQIIFSFFLTATGIGSSLQYVTRSIGILSALAQTVAIGLVSVGLIMVANRVMKEKVD